MRKRRHPFWLGLLVACVFAAALTLRGPVEVSGTYDLAGGLLLRAAGVEAPHPAGVVSRMSDPLGWETLLALGIPVGAFLGALPERIRRGKRREKLPPVRWQACLGSFVCGAALLFGAGMAGGGMSGHLLSGLMQGSLSAFAFAAAALAAGIPAALTARAVLQKRKEAAEHD